MNVKPLSYLRDANLKQIVLNELFAQHNNA